MAREVTTSQESFEEHRRVMEESQLELRHANETMDSRAGFEMAEEDLHDGMDEYNDARSILTVIPAPAHHKKLQQPVSPTNEQIPSKCGCFERVSCMFSQIYIYTYTNSDPLHRIKSSKPNGNRTRRT